MDVVGPVIFILFLVAVYLYQNRGSRITGSGQNPKKQKPRKSAPRRNQRSTNDDLIKGYELHVTPQIWTPLRVLKLRNKKFATKHEAESVDFEMNEAIALPITGGGMHNSSVATKLGPMKGRKLERYYDYLERFRAIIEAEPLSPPERCEKVRQMKFGRNFLKKLKKVYGSDFPKNVFVKQFEQIDGISLKVGSKLYDHGIYTPEYISDFSKEELMKINGIGKAKAESLMDYKSK